MRYMRNRMHGWESGLGSGKWGDVAIVFIMSFHTAYSAGKHGVSDYNQTILLVPIVSSCSGILSSICPSRNSYDIVNKPRPSSP